MNLRLFSLHCLFTLHFAWKVAGQDRLTHLGQGSKTVQPGGQGRTVCPVRQALVGQVGGKHNAIPLILVTTHTLLSMPRYTVLILLQFGKYLTILLKRLPLLCDVWILCSVGAFGASLWTSWGLKIPSWPHFSKLHFCSVYGVPSVG